VLIRDLEEADRPWVTEWIVREWGLPVVSISGNYDPSNLPGYVAEVDGEVVGAITFHLSDSGCEVVTLNSLWERQGIGTALLARVKHLADHEGLRLWLITTNENIDAIRFYQRRGMDIAALHRDFVDVVRRFKPQVTDHEDRAIRFQHALELSY
jgi:GNAT superfamily N-acetyltransferase